MPANDPSAGAFALLDQLGIQHRTVEHLPLHTVEESRRLRGELPGGHVKNLFLKDKGSRLFLVTAEEGSPLDLKTLDKAIGARGRLSFASAGQLLEHLGILPGSVSPLALVNETAGAVTFIIEKKLLDFDIINVHPLINTRTTTLAMTDLLTYVQATAHPIVALELPYRALEPEPN